MGRSRSLLCHVDGALQACRSNLSGEKREKEMGKRAVHEAEERNQSKGRGAGGLTGPYGKYRGR